MNAKHFLFSLIVLQVASFAFANSPEANPTTIQVLTIGNSFADDATAFLPQVAQSAGRIEISVTRANPGGWTLRQHADAAADPNAKPYKIDGQRTDLRTILSSRDWDFVTIQQMSEFSYQADSFQPFADQIAAMVYELAPMACLVIQQTWAYRGDSPLLERDGLDADEMYSRLASNYQELSERLDAGILPVGAAIEAVRRDENRGIWKVDSEFDFAAPVYPNLPDQTGSLVKGYRWQSAGDQHRLNLDYRHLNDAGRLLAALVWYQSLTGLDARDSHFRPESVSEPDAVLFRRVAMETVSQFGPVSACQTAAQ